MGDVTRHKYHEAVQKPLTAGSVGKGRMTFNTEQKRKLQRLIGRQLEQSGYPPADHDLA